MHPYPSYGVDGLSLDRLQFSLGLSLTVLAKNASEKAIGSIPLSSHLGSRMVGLTPSVLSQPYPSTRKPLHVLLWIVWPTSLAPCVKKHIGHGVCKFTESTDPCKHLVSRVVCKVGASLNYLQNYSERLSTFLTLPVLVLYSLPLLPCYAILYAILLHEKDGLLLSHPCVCLCSY